MYGKPTYRPRVGGSKAGQSREARLQSLPSTRKVGSPQKPLESQKYTVWLHLSSNSSSTVNWTTTIPGLHFIGQRSSHVYKPLENEHTVPGNRTRCFQHNIVVQHVIYRGFIGSNIHAYNIDPRHVRNPPVSPLHLFHLCGRHGSCVGISLCPSRVKPLLVPLKRRVASL